MRYARISGISLLFIIVCGVLDGLFFHDNLIVGSDAAATASSILRSERLWRIGLAEQELSFISDIILAWSLYALLREVNKNLALLGSIFRLTNAILLGFAVITSFVVLDLLDGDSYLHMFAPGQLQSLSMLFINMHGDVELVGIICFCIGAAVHSYLLFISRYIPRFLSGFYFIAVIQLMICCFLLIIFPHWVIFKNLYYVLPDFIAELLVAVWLLVKGVNKKLEWSEDINP